MKYNFDKILDRSGSGSVKYDLRKTYFGKEDVIPLWVADMDFETPDFIINALQERLQHPVLGYGIRDDAYLDSISKWVGDRFQWEIKNNEISFSPGVVPGIVMAILAFTEPGDKVMVQPPVYFPFYISVKENHRELIYNQLIESEQGYQIDFADMEAKFKDGVKMLIISNPHNPVGRVWIQSELEQIIALCEKYEVMIISDEIHADLTFKPHKHIPIASISETAANRCITFMAASKTFNIAGLSTAFAIIKQKKILRMYNKKLNAIHLFSGNILGTVATKAAFDYGNSWRLQMLDYVQKNIDFVEQFLIENLPDIRFYRPQATYLLWLDFRKLDWEQKKLVRFMIEKAGIGLNDGTVFSPGGEGFMRMNVACSRLLLKKVLNQILQAFQV